ncbi:hypothetical protein CBR_g20293 [Chara braunii]|uniref:Uncharacterized protein n=1 Tax=Chara braunii TaxID=69332 RepID=A0A388L029_CHABU|nr:hypothetical protein CBR_g20293 [Chara braunii]|eukprot:GBG75666.1 hypothetical protein CBR_g20293 [Chara braunii]
MVPVYAIMSLLALTLSDKAIYFNTIRDVYEAWVIYNFLSLCLAWVGGPGAVVVSLNGRLLKPSWVLMTCCLQAIPLDGRFIRRCKQGVLQFVIAKPILAAFSLIMYSRGKFEDGDFSPKGGYLYVTLAYTVSYSLALYALVLFFVATRDLLRPFNPLPKFLIIKSVVFLTYWQGVLIFLLSKGGLINSKEDAADLQNLLICLEMAVAAVGHLWAFPHQPYANAVGAAGGLGGNISHAMNFNDVVYDTVHQFAPTYHDYILYSDGSQSGPRRYRTRTFVPTGQEMEHTRKHKDLKSGASVAGVTTSVEARSPPSPTISGVKPGQDRMQTSLLSEQSFAGPVPYDMSPLDLPKNEGRPPLSSRGPSTTEYHVGRQSTVDSRRTSAAESRVSMDDREISDRMPLTTERRRSTDLLMDDIDLSEGHTAS